MVFMDIYILTRQVFAYLGLLHVFFLLFIPREEDVFEAGPGHDVKGHEDNFCARVGKKPDICIVLLSSRVTYPEIQPRMLNLKICLKPNTNNSKDIF